MTTRTAGAVFALYRSLGWVIAPFLGLVVRLRARRGKEDMARRRERFGKASVQRPEGSLVWIHAASVGETLVALPLIKHIEAAGPHVLLTTGTVTSANLAAYRIGPKTIHQYVPMDVVPFMRRFLKHWKPDLTILVESELWPATLSQLARNNIPHVLVNARMSEKSYRRWLLAPSIIETLLRPVTLCLAQTIDDGERYRALGAPRVNITGNMKFDAIPPDAQADELQALMRDLAGRPTWLAASTHEGEEKQIAHVHKALLQIMPDLVTIIAPRHPQRGDTVVQTCAKLGLETAQRSADEPLTSTTQVYVADTIGELGLFYRAVPVGFLGGSLIKHGGQNPIEAAKLDTAILHGPHVWNFAEIYGAIDIPKGAVQVNNASDLAKALATLLRQPDKTAKHVHETRKALSEFEGAISRTITALGPMLHAMAVSAELEGVRE